eukprot:1922379-Rhodomonas_salina.2
MTPHASMLFPFSCLDLPYHAGIFLYVLPRSLTVSLAPSSRRPQCVVTSMLYTRNESGFPLYIRRLTLPLIRDADTNDRVHRVARSSPPPGHLCTSYSMQPSSVMLAHRVPTAEEYRYVAGPAAAVSSVHSNLHRELRTEGIERSAIFVLSASPDEDRGRSSSSWSSCRPRNSSGDFSSPNTESRSHISSTRDCTSVGLNAGSWAAVCAFLLGVAVEVPLGVVGAGRRRRFGFGVRGPFRDTVDPCG